ncbi:MAG: hypothetical protein JWQ03_298, partial [Variovorax sp.]|nr:hypothetical protein [Variovorax sp.]
LAGWPTRAAAPAEPAVPHGDA